MFKKFSFWIWGTIIMQLLTAVFHSMSFFVTPEPTNETEKQLMDLTRNYKPDAGMGFNPSFKDIFTALSLSFTLICLFGAVLNWYLKKEKIAADLWKGVLLIEIIIFGGLFAGMLVFTFIAPVVCTLLIFIFICGAYISRKI